MLLLGLVNGVKSSLGSPEYTWLAVILSIMSSTEFASVPVSSSWPVELVSCTGAARPTAAVHSNSSRE